MKPVFLGLLWCLFAVSGWADETIDRIVAQVGDDPILETELLQAAMLEAQNSGIDLSKDDSKLDSLKHQVLKSIVDFRVLLEVAKKDTNIKVAEAEAKGKADEDYQRMSRQVGGEAALAERFGMPTRKIKKTLEDNARNQLYVQRYSESKLNNLRVTKEEVEKFWKDNQSQFPELPPAIRLENILITVKPTDESRTNALKRADSIATLAQHGSDFAELAKKLSDDEMSAKTGGDLGESTRGTFLPEFEAASFKLSEDGISDPIETSYGFHIIKLHWKRGNKFHVSHILVSLRPTASDSAATKLLVKNISDSLKAGIAFEKLAKTYSHDIETASRNGDMGWFDKSKIPDQFAEPVKSLKLGEWVGPITIKGGFHFLKLAESRDRRKPDIKLDWDRIERIAQANARTDAYQKLVDNLRKDVFIQFRK